MVARSARLCRDAPRAGDLPAALLYTAHASFQESLRALVVDTDAAIGFAVAAVIVLALTPLAARLAPHVGGVDERNDRPRVHARPVPRIGGLAIVTASWSAP